MQPIQQLVPRRAQELLAEAMADTRVVTLNGARQTGKSTLARLAAQASPGAVVRLLDDPATSRAAHDDPASFVEHDGLMVIDEVQLAPELFRSIKVVVDPDSIRFISGASVDYVEDVMGGGFKIDNPNAVRSCGCGSSFSTDDGSEAAGGGCG